MSNEGNQITKRWGLEEAVEAFYPSYKDAKKRYSKEKQYNPEDGKLLEFLDRTADIMGLTKITDEHRAKFRKLVASEVVYILGYVLPYVEGDYPRRISANVFNGSRVDWEKNKIITSTREIHGVFVIQNQNHANAPSSIREQSSDNQVNAVVEIKPTVLKQPEKTKGKKVGRPSFAETIYAVYVQLRDGGYIDFTQTQKAIMNQVRHEVHKADPEVFPFSRRTRSYKNLSDSTLKSVLAEVINSDKSQ